MPKMKPPGQTKNRYVYSNNLINYMAQQSIESRGLATAFCFHLHLSEDMWRIIRVVSMAILYSL